MHEHVTGWPGYLVEEHLSLVHFENKRWFLSVSINIFNHYDFHHAIATLKQWTSNPITLSRDSSLKWNKGLRWTFITLSTKKHLQITKEVYTSLKLPKATFTSAKLWTRPDKRLISEPYNSLLSVIDNCIRIIIFCYTNKRCATCFYYVSLQVTASPSGTCLATTLAFVSQLGDWSKATDFANSGV